MLYAPAHWPCILTLLSLSPLPLSIHLFYLHPCSSFLYFHHVMLVRGKPLHRVYVVMQLYLHYHSNTHIWSKHLNSTPLYPIQESARLCLSRVWARLVRSRLTDPDTPVTSRDAPASTANHANIRDRSSSGNMSKSSITLSSILLNGIHFTVWCVRTLVHPLSEPSHVRFQMVSNWQRDDNFYDVIVVVVILFSVAYHYLSPLKSSTRPQL